MSVLIGQDIREGSLYNQETKIEFLGDYPDSTQYTYKRIFEASAEMEQSLGKDLHEFDSSEIVEFLQSLEPQTFASSRTNGRIVSAYLNWAVGHRIRHKANPLASVKPVWFEKFVKVEQSDLFLTEKELRRLEDRLVNYQDSAIFRLLFEGIQGKGCHELTTLSKSNVDVDHNRITVQDDDGTERTENVSIRCMKLLERAMAQREYVKRNGEMDTSMYNLNDSTTLVNNGYVFRNSLTRTDKYNSPIDKHTIYRRIDMVKELFEMPYLTVKNVVRSGMIHMGKELLEEYGKLEKEQYEMIAERFRINGWWRIQEFCNEDIINKKYR